MHDIIERKIDTAEGVFLTRTQRVKEIVDTNKALRNEGLTGINGMKLVARIPTSVVDHYCAINKISLNEFLTNQKHKKKLLNDPNFSDFR
ncbi:MAG: hypothetical protein ACKO96_01565, partial [Flammeovirgaceae bacterium]